MPKNNHTDPGYIYIMSNQSMPGLVKVGVTTRCVLSRAAELYTTGVPAPFKVEFAIFTESCHEVEGWVHDQLDPYRVNGSREFFRLPVEDAVVQASGMIFQASESLFGASIEPCDDWGGRPVLSAV